tara:strand:+ start:798 stop:1016 length:219 start_codon:yes stop_codon:yes gene_type:complete
MEPMDIPHMAQYSYTLLKYKKRLSTKEKKNRFRIGGAAQVAVVCARRCLSIAIFIKLYDKPQTYSYENHPNK